MNTKNSDHGFSVEMNYKRLVRSISISDESRDRVLFDGNLGILLNILLVEGSVLELVGNNGVLRVAVTERQLRKALETASQESLALRRRAAQRSLECEDR